MVALLSGCMAELQVGQRPAGSPPAARPSAAAPSPSPQPPLPQPSAPGSLAPDPATVAPTPPPPTQPLPTRPAPTAAPASTPLPPLALPTAPAQSNEERWRAQQQNRMVFDGLLPFSTTGSELWWYDPVNQQHVILGVITGDFVAQAQFQPLGHGVEALEVPYQVNASFGLTALSPALLERITAAGYASDWVETYVFFSPNVTQR